MLPFFVEEAEHYGYCDELFALDLRDDQQARFAIEKWLVPQVSHWSIVGRNLRQEAARVCIAQNIPFSGYWLPRIDDRWRSTGDLIEHSENIAVFQRQIWGHLFNEPYCALPLGQFVLRVDKEFERFPDSPELWIAPKHSQWPASFNGRD